MHEIALRGRTAYLSDPILQEAGDSLMMKVGESARRLSRMGVLAPDESLQALIDEAEETLGIDDT